ncbi:nuclear transport factor 2 family protein [Kitasatospora purpeofusca]|uniref:nuclear transport factor 2 family protein n=1 Tax=Kitasatospora purpeofusca TaxID=67352 RepID=UPI002256CCAC|nr:nuclear transport factor 2 family protein [Kitasatospora purpeofusca]MCX4690404.1 nuclear transport factor 2 family protein [Kitasatospora purpeofusca]
MPEFDVPEFDESERKAFVERWVAMWESPTAPADAMAYYTEDAVIEDKAFGHTYRGHQELHEYFARAGALFSDIRSVSAGVLVGRSHAVAHVQYGATIREPFLCLPESSRGKSFSLYVMSQLEFAEDGRIVRSVDAYDRTAVLQQLGVLPAGVLPPAGVRTPFSGTAPSA